MLSLCAIGGCQTLDAVGGLLIGKVQRAAQQSAQIKAEAKRTEILRSVIRQEILTFFRFLQEQGLLLSHPSFNDWTPKDLGPVDPETGLLLPKTVLPPLYERPQDIPEDLVKEFHNDTTRTNSREQRNVIRTWEPLEKAEGHAATGSVNAGNPRCGLR
jgi:hypothetical protein